MEKLKFKIDDVIYQMPKSWNDTTFGQWLDLISYLENEKSNSPLKININLITIMTGVDELKKILFEKVDEESITTLANSLKWIYDHPDVTKFTENKFEDNQIITVDDKRFKLKSNYSNQLSNYEVVHMQELASNESMQYTPWELAFGILFRQLDEQGNELEISPDLIFNTIENFRNKITMGTIYPVLYFFLNGEKKSSTKGSKISLGGNKSTIQILTDQEKNTRKGKEKKAKV